MAIQLLVKSQTHGQVNTEELRQYSRRPVPYSLGTPHGYMTRTEKAKGINHLLKSVNDALVPSDAKTLLISCYDRYSKQLPTDFLSDSWQYAKACQLLVQYGYGIMKDQSRI